MSFNNPMFLNSLMLAGLGGALLPLVLHLLGRARHRNVEWGAMMFLDGAAPRDRQSARVKQYVLLATRMAIVAALAMAMARPVAGEAWAGLAPGGSTTAVLVLDCSASMAIVEGGRSRMDVARDVASQLLAALKRGDRVSLLTSGVAQDEGDLVPSSDLRTVAARVAAARPGAGRADLARDLTTAARLLKRYGAGQDARVLVVTDRQAVNWRDVSPGFAADWKAGLGMSTDTANRLSVFPVGADLADNVAVESVALVNPPAVRNESAEVEVRVRSFGPTAQPSVAVALQRSGRAIGVQRVSVPAGDVATARFGVKFDTIGSHVLTARVAGVGFTADDVFNAAVEVTDPIGLLFVSGDETEGVATAESTFFRVAAAPYAASGRPGVDPVAVTVVGAERFAPVALKGQRVLVLANVPQVSDEWTKAIEQFVYEGGGLLVAPGGLVDVEQYNAVLWRDGAGVLPAALQPATSAGGAAATTLLGIDFAHPAFAFLKGRPDPIPGATVGRYFPVVPRQPDAQVPATFASGGPFLVEARWGRGRVALVTTPLDADWSTLPLSGFYVPFVQSLVRHLASASDADRDLVPGAPFIAIITEPIDGEPVIRPPDSRRATPSVTRAGGRTEVRYDNTSAPGLYRLQYRSGRADRTVFFVVRASPDESDLTPLTPARWDELAATLGARRIDAGAEPVSVALAGARQGRELWAPLLMLTGLLLAGEMYLGRRWSGGGVR